MNKEEIINKIYEQYIDLLINYEKDNKRLYEDMNLNNFNVKEEYLNFIFKKCVLKNIKNTEYIINENKFNKFLKNNNLSTRDKFSKFISLYANYEVFGPIIHPINEDLKDIIIKEEALDNSKI